MTHVYVNVSNITELLNWGISKILPKETENTVKKKMKFR